MTFAAARLKNVHPPTASPRNNGFLSANGFRLTETSRWTMYLQCKRGMCRANASLVRNCTGAAKPLRHGGISCRSAPVRSACVWLWPTGNPLKLFACRHARKNGKAGNEIRRSEASGAKICLSVSPLAKLCNRHGQSPGKNFYELF